MALSSFRELLIKRSEDPELATLIKFIREDVIVDMVHESLEKMARAKHKGMKANSALRHFATEMDDDNGPRMIHDALSHHVSRYKKAVSDGRQDLANQHAKQAFRIINMSDQASGHSEGKLDVSAPSIQSWERHGKQNKYETSDAKVQEGKYQAGEFKTKTKGFGYTGKDYSWLQNDPHESYGKETNVTGHKGAYPFEKIRVNGKHLSIDNDVDLKGYEKHEFDKHPVMDHFEESAKHRTPEKEKEYRDAHDAYEDGPHMDSYFDRHDKMKAADPEGYARRGSYEDSPVHPKENSTTMDVGLGDTPKDSFSNIDTGGMSPAMQEIAANKGKPKE